MARDYLAVPSTSVAVERWFSDGPELIKPCRSSLNENSISTVLELKNILHFGGEELFSIVMKEFDLHAE